MTPRTWAYGEPEGGDDDEAARDRPYESFGRQGVALPTYAGGPDCGAERVELGEPVAASTRDGHDWQERDERVHDDVCSHLAADGQVDASDVEVIVHRGEVILSGTVPTPAERARALQVADLVSGVVDVVDRLRVVSSRR